MKPMAWCLKGALSKFAGDRGHLVFNQVGMKELGVRLIA